MKISKKYCKASSIIALGIVLTLVTTSCGTKPNDTVNTKNDANVTAPGQLPIVKDKVTITIGTAANAGVQDYETNEYTKWLEEQSNIDLKFELYPNKEAGQKVEIMLASGSELPDIIMASGVNDNAILKYSKQKVFLPLNDYIDKQGFFIKRMFEKAQDKDVKKKMALADGIIYGVPYYIEQTGNRWSQKAWINKKWLDNLGMKIPETTDEFYEVLKAFKTKDPNKNGKADEVPFTGYKKGWNTNPIDFVMNAFIYDDLYNKYIVKDGKVNVAYSQDEWKDGLKYLNKLVKEGLLDPMFFTQEGTQLKQLGMAEGGNRVGAFPSGSGPREVSDATSDVQLEYVSLPPLKGPKGVQWSADQRPTPNNMAVITKYSKNPLAAFRLLDLMYSEESSIRCRFGVPEKDWVKPAPGEQSYFASIGAKPVIKPILEYGASQNSHWKEMQPTFRALELSDGMVWDGDTKNLEYARGMAVKNYIGKAPKEVVSKLIFTLDEMEQIKEPSMNLSNYVNENAAKFIMLEKNIDENWDAYKAELEKMGLKKYIELSQIGYDRATK